MLCLALEPLASQHAGRMREGAWPAHIDTMREEKENKLTLTPWKSYGLATLLAFALLGSIAKLVILFVIDLISLASI